MDMKIINRDLMGLLTRWFRYYVIFPKAVLFIWGLVLVYSWAESGLVALWITHLTEDNVMTLKQTTIIVNLLDGISAFLVLIMAYLSKTYVGPYLSLVCTTTAYIFGLMLYYHGGFVYATVVLVGLGRAGCDVQLKEFLTDQCRTNEAGEDEERVVSRRKIWWRSAYILGVAASVTFFTTASWAMLSLIILIAMAVAFVLFLLGMHCVLRAQET